MFIHEVNYMGEEFKVQIGAKPPDILVLIILLLVLGWNVTTDKMIVLLIVIFVITIGQDQEHKLYSVYIYLLLSHPKDHVS